MPILTQTHAPAPESSREERSRGPNVPARTLAHVQRKIEALEFLPPATHQVHGQPQVIRLEPKEVAGRYVLLRLLAVGGMAEVWLARQTGIAGFEKLVVLKKIHPHLASNPEFVRMFLDEARTAGDLRHANVVSVTDAGADGGTYFIVMEYLHGRDLSQVVQRCTARSEKVPLGHALQVVSEAALGLDYAHLKLDLRGAAQQIVHRDVSPQNVFVTFDGGTKLLDFGIASASSRTTQTEAGVVKGKFGYMSPEQVDGALLDARSDQFSLAIVLHELLAQQPLFGRKSESETFRAVSQCSVAPLTDISPELNGVVLKALSKDPAQRFESCGDFAVALTGILESEAIAHSAARVGAWLKTMFTEHDQPPTATAEGVPTRNERLKGCPG